MLSDPAYHARVLLPSSTLPDASPIPLTWRRCVTHAQLIDFLMKYLAAQVVPMLDKQARKFAAGGQLAQAMLQRGGRSKDSLVLSIPCASAHSPDRLFERPTAGGAVRIGGDRALAGDKALVS